MKNKHIWYEIHPVVAMDLSGKYATDKTLPDEVVWEKADKAALQDPTSIRGWSVYGWTTDWAMEELIGPFSTAKEAQTEAVKRGYILGKKESMKYKLRVGPSTEFYFSNMEKAALALRTLAEADCGAKYIGIIETNTSHADLRLEPIWPEEVKLETTNSGT